MQIHILEVFVLPVRLLLILTTTQWLKKNCWILEKFYVFLVYRKQAISKTCGMQRYK